MSTHRLRSRPRGVRSTARQRPTPTQCQIGAIAATATRGGKTGLLDPGRAVPVTWALSWDSYTAGHSIGGARNPGKNSRLLERAQPSTEDVSRTTRASDVKHRWVAPPRRPGLRAGEVPEALSKVQNTRGAAVCHSFLHLPIALERSPHPERRHRCQHASHGSAHPPLRHAPRERFQRGSVPSFERIGRRITRFPPMRCAFPSCLEAQLGKVLATRRHASPRRIPRAAPPVTAPVTRPPVSPPLASRTPVPPHPTPAQLTEAPTSRPRPWPRKPPPASSTRERKSRPAAPRTSTGAHGPRPNRVPRPACPKTHSTAV